VVNVTVGPTPVVAAPSVAIARHEYLVLGLRAPIAWTIVAEPVPSLVWVPVVAVRLEPRPYWKATGSWVS
jgi:hypothetical protein